MNSPAAMLLDLDDTILADTDVSHECWRSVCRRFAHTLEGMTEERLYAAVCRTGGWYWSDLNRHRLGRSDLRSARRDVVGLAFKSLEIDAPDFAVQVADAYTTLREEIMRPFPGAIHAVEQLQRNGIQLALVTNGPTSLQRMKLQRFDLEQYFGCIVIEGEFGVGKPHPSVFEHALDGLKCHPSEAWMIGDSLIYDIEPALQLGMRGIWVDFANTGLPSSASCNPSRIISALTELL